jgi:outer membrane protein TolC
MPWTAGVARSALAEVVQAHVTAAEQQARLELLLQQLVDKEALLEQARQLVSAGGLALFAWTAAFL